MVSLLGYGLVGNHVLGQVFHDSEVGVDQLIVELDFVFGKLVVVGVDLVDQLPVELQYLLELLSEQALGALVNLLLLVLVVVKGPYFLPQVGVHRLTGI